jgi:ketosteroid isomerase-like protein
MESSAFGQSRDTAQAMSQENVEILRQALQAFGRGDEDDWLSAWHADAEFYDFTELPDIPQPYRGHEGVRRWAANVRSVLGDFRMDPQEFTRIGDAVLMEIEVRGAGVQSGIPVVQIVYVLAWMRGDKIARTRAFLEKEQALEAAGLSG